MTLKNTMVYGYVRVSSDKQTVKNQKFEIEIFCRDNSIKIDDWIEETISGTRYFGKRELGKLLRKVTKEALARRRAEGVVLGRPKGRKNSPLKHKLYGKRHLIKELLAQGYSKNKIARICKVNRGTLYRFLTELTES